MDCRVAVIGAGAAGLLCAYKAAGRGGVLLLDGNEKPGRKLLATGNGRCNITNLRLSPDDYCGDPLLGDFLRHWPAGRLTDIFRELGLLTRADSEGRVYPNSLQAAAVAGALASACHEAGVREQYGFRAVKIARERHGFIITGDNGGTVRAKYCVLACGGLASPGHSRGEGYSLAKGLGHRVTELSPSLVGLRVKGRFTRALKGVRCKARASLRAGGRELCGESGEVIFGDGSVSGICVMDLSAHMRGRNNTVLRLDLLEHMDSRELENYLKSLALAHPMRPVEELFSGALNLRLGRELSKLLGFGGTLGELGPGAIKRAAGMAKGLDLPVEGTLGWEQAQVTAGGVPLCEIDLGTMESRICPGLYICGELLDADGRCGGYNLHWAFCTGAAAGEQLG